MPLTTFSCWFPDFDGIPVRVDAADTGQAAERAAAWWERDIEDFRVLRGEETLRVQVQAGGGFLAWEVVGRIQ